MGSKKKVVKKKIQKKLQKDKQKKNEKKDKIKELKDKMKKAVNGDMSKIEYQQNLLDPRFRAAMVGLNGFPYPQSGLSNANQYLQEHREKNNELTRRLGFEQDVAKLKQENKSLKHEIKEQIENFKRDAIVKQQQQEIEDLKKKKVQTEKEFKENEEFHSEKHDLESKINETKQKEKKIYKRRQHKNIITKLKNEKDDVEHEEREMKERHELDTHLENAKRKLKKLKQEYEEGKIKDDFKNQVEDIEFEIRKSKEKRKHKQEIDELKSELNELKRLEAENEDKNKLEDEKLNLETKATKIKANVSPEAKEEHYNDMKPLIEENAVLGKKVELLGDRVKAEKQNQKLRNQAMEMYAQIEDKSNLPQIDDPDFKEKMFDNTLQIKTQTTEINENIKRLKQNIEARQKFKLSLIQQNGLENVINEEEAEKARVQELEETNIRLNEQVKSSNAARVELANRLTTFENEVRDLTRSSNEKDVQMALHQKKHKQVLRITYQFSKYLSPEQQEQAIKESGGITNARKTELENEITKANEEFIKDSQTGANMEFNPDIPYSYVYDPPPTTDTVQTVNHTITTPPPPSMNTVQTVNHVITTPPPPSMNPVQTVNHVITTPPPPSMNPVQTVNHVITTPPPPSMNPVAPVQTTSNSNRRLPQNSAPVEKKPANFIPALKKAGLLDEEEEDEIINDALTVVESINPNTQHIIEQQKYRAQQQQLKDLTS